MPADALPIIALTVAAALGTAALALQPWWAARRRRRVAAQAFPAGWRRILRQRVPFVARLPPSLQQRLKRHIQVFVAEKAFIGCQGQVIDDEVRVTIAAHAGLLLLGHDAAPCYPGLRQILVYPGAFATDRERALGAGLVQTQRQTMSGESWSQGQVILSWDDVLAGSANPDDGHNVALHEFAHQIDQDKGEANGRPWRPGVSQRQRWAHVLGEAFARLQREPSAVIDAYGASDPAEFFAVAVEVFFERPHDLKAVEPALFGELVALFQLDPACW